MSHENNNLHEGNKMNNCIKLTLQVFAFVNLLSIRGLCAMNVNNNLVNKYFKTKNMGKDQTNIDFILLKETFKDDNIMLPHPAALSHNKTFFVLGSNNNTAKIWDLSEEDKCLATLTGHSEFILGAAISHDDNFIVTVSKDKTVKIWDANQSSDRYGKCLLTLIGHTDAVPTVAVSRDWKYIVTGSLDNTIKIWDVKGNCFATLIGHENGILLVFTDADDKYIGTVSRNNIVKIWELIRHDNFIPVEKDSHDNKKCKIKFDFNINYL